MATTDGSSGVSVVWLTPVESDIAATERLLGSSHPHRPLVDRAVGGDRNAESELETRYDAMASIWSGWASSHADYYDRPLRECVSDTELGDVLELSDTGLARAGRVPAGYLYVDGIVGDVGQGVLRDRRVLAEEGVVVVIVTVDIETGKVLTGPEIITRGWVYAPEAEDLLDEACDRVAAVVEQSLASGVRDVESLERDVRRAAGKFVNERTKRRPMIVPVVMET